MGANHLPQIGRAFQAGEGIELRDIVLVGTPGFPIGDVGQPFQLWRHAGELAELCRCQGGLAGQNQVEHELLFQHDNVFYRA